MRYGSLRLLLALATQDDLDILTFDVRTAFLYGRLEEKIHMELPEGIQASESSSKRSTSTRSNSTKEMKTSERKSVVCKLNKSLYGLNRRRVVGTSVLKSSLTNLVLKSVMRMAVYS